MSSGVTYRPEIDGLRAVAVVPVLLFHAGFEEFSGGFLGVDIFFVISGYLITSLLLAEMRSTQKISILGFYERRARRILPALFLVILVSVPIAWLLLLPADLKFFSKSATYVLMFASNILFASKVDYFDPLTSDIPLLHTWSLAVEEQFYVAFPLLFVWIARWNRKSISVVLLCVATLSLVYAQYSSLNSPVQSFFLLPSRVWELCFGAMLANHESRANSTMSGGNCLSLAGVGLIIASIFILDESFPHPGLITLFPVLGTVLVIAFARHGTVVGRMLSSSVAVSVGLCSYSAYLWHQPVLAFGRLSGAVTDGTALSLLLVASCFALAYVSWRFVEQPFRGRSTLSSVLVFTVLTLIALGIFAFDFSVREFKGFPDRNPRMVEIEHRLRPNVGLSPLCEYGSEYFKRSDCTHGSNENTIIWGDSLAGHLAPALVSANIYPGFVQATRSTCGPFADLSPIYANVSREKAEHCIAFNESVLKHILASRELKNVIFSAHLDHYLDNTGYFLTGGKVVDASFDALFDSLMKNIDKLNLAGKRILFVSPPASNGRNYAGCLSRAYLRRSENAHCEFTIFERIEKQASTILFLEKLKQRGVTVINLAELTCDSKRCGTTFENKWLYRDGIHLSYEGAEWIGKNFPQ